MSIIIAHMVLFRIFIGKYNFIDFHYKYNFRGKQRKINIMYIYNWENLVLYFKLFVIISSSHSIKYRNPGRNSYIKYKYT